MAAKNPFSFDSNSCKGMKNELWIEKLLHFLKGAILTLGAICEKAVLDKPSWFLKSNTVVVAWPLKEFDLYSAITPILNFLESLIPVKTSIEVLKKLFLSLSFICPLLSSLISV